jgi:hypothetical protein
MGTKNGLPQGFCMHIGPEPIVDRDEDAEACGKFELSIAALVTKSPVPSLYTHTCGECKHWAEDKMELNGTGACLRFGCGGGKRGTMDLACIHFDERKKPVPPVPSVPLISCLECKHAERVSDDINTWKCALGGGFAGYVKVECKRFEAL